MPSSTPRLPAAFLLSLFASTTTGGSLFAEENQSSSPKPSYVAESIQNLADNVTPSMPWQAKTVDEHEKWQGEFQKVIVGLIGKMPAAVPPEVQWIEKVERELYTRHKVLVRTEQEYWSPVYYFVPKKIDRKVPAIVCLHGHSGIVPYIDESKTEEGRKKTREHELDYAIHFAERGYVTAAIVVRGWDETNDRQDPGVKSPRRGCYQITMTSLLLGMSPQGLRCWDAMRVIDFLQTQPEVDGEQIGVAGLSGGGTLALYLPVLDPRVKLVMIGGAFSSYRASIYSIHHCICNCLPGVMQYGDMSDVVALYAPRPVLLINGINDPIFPIQEAREGYAKLQEVYRLLGKEENIDADFFDGPHAWSNRKTIPFLKKHFGE